MSGFVVYKGHTGWFHWTTAENWDARTSKPYRHVPNPDEIGRYETKAEAKKVRHLYNQMVHGMPTNSATYNRLLEERND